MSPRTMIAGPPRYTRRDGDGRAACGRERRGCGEVGSRIVDELGGPDLGLALVFVDWRLDADVIATTTYRGLRGPVIGGTTVGVIGHSVGPERGAAVAMGLYGDWLRVGLAVAPELTTAALIRSRDAVRCAATMLGTTADVLTSPKHVGVSLIASTDGSEEAFCIGSAAAAPKMRFVGGCTSTELGSSRMPCVWINGEVLTDASVVLVLESELPIHALLAAHVTPTAARTVVTAASGRMIDELDGYPAVPRLHQLLSTVGASLTNPSTHSFARYIDGMPYLRALLRVHDDRLELASSAEVGQVLHVMRSGDLIEQTRQDLANARARVGGELAGLLVFSCVGRHLEANAGGIESELAAAYAATSACGLQTAGEQFGTMFVSYSLTGLAIACPAPADVGETEAPHAVSGRA